MQIKIKQEMMMQQEFIPTVVEDTVKPENREIIKAYAERCFIADSWEDLIDERATVFDFQLGLWALHCLKYLFF